MRERHVDHKTKCLIFRWITTQSSDMHAWSIMHGPHTNLKRMALFERHVTPCTGSEHPELSQVIVKQHVTSQQLSQEASPSWCWKHHEIPGHGLNHEVNHVTSDREQTGTESLSLDQKDHNWERKKQNMILKRGRDGNARLRKGLHRRIPSGHGLRRGLEERCRIQESNGDIPWTQKATIASPVILALYQALPTPRLYSQQTASRIAGKFYAGPFLSTGLQLLPAWTQRWKSFTSQDQALKDTENYGVPKQSISDTSNERLTLAPAASFTS